MIEQRWTMLLLAAGILGAISTYPVGAFAASFDCIKAQSKIEHLVCDTPKLSELDSKLGKVYEEALKKATPDQKKQLVAEQKHWLSFTRAPCDTETCLKHAYWSRQAALEAWFMPRAPIYQHESEKAEVIQKMIAPTPINRMPTHPLFCREIFKDLKEMKGIRFVDPVVQTQSYENPALDRWKKNCRTSTPFHASIACAIRGWEGLELEVCDVGYGLPPFKLYELPPSATSKTKFHVLYFGESYGPMNKMRGYGKEALYGGGGYPDFKFFNPETCSILKIHTPTGPHDHGSMNYSSIVEYKGSYYVLAVVKKDGENWISIGTADERQEYCYSTPVSP